MNTNLEILSSHQIQAQRPGHIGFGNSKVTQEVGKSNSTFENTFGNSIPGGADFEVSSSDDLPF